MSVRVGFTIHLFAKPDVYCEWEVAEMIQIICRLPSSLPLRLAPCQRVSPKFHDTMDQAMDYELQALYKIKCHVNRSDPPPKGISTTALDNEIECINPKPFASDTERGVLSGPFHENAIPKMD